MESIKQFISYVKEEWKAVELNPLYIAWCAVAVFTGLLVGFAITERFREMDAKIERSQSANRVSRVVGAPWRVDTILVAQPWESCSDLDGRLPAGNGQTGYLYAFPGEAEVKQERAR